MRGVSKLLSLSGVLLLGLAGAASFDTAAATGGLTLTPATLTLTLEPGASEQKASFSLTNQYGAVLTLSFAVEPRIGTAGDADPSAHIFAGQKTMSLQAGETAVQTLTLRDSGKLSPGSQLADLVITQIGSPQTGIGVMSGIRMPLVAVKKDGAVSAVSLAKFGAPRLGFGLPGSLEATIHNNGNMIAIPRGFMAVTAPGGKVVSQGVLNLSSQAVVPGEDITLAAPLTRLNDAFWPGIYRLELTYGLGGGQTAQTASRWFIYAAWWHAVVLAALLAGGYYGGKLVRKRARMPPSRHPPTRGYSIRGRL